MALASILLVEGATAGDNSFAAMLEAKGYKVSVAHSGREALQRFRSDPPDLAVLDTLSLRSNGTRIAQALRQKAPDLPLIVIRAAHGRAITAPVDVTLIAPFTPRKLLNHIARLAPRTDVEELTVGHLRLNLAQRCVSTPQRERCLLTPKQMKLLETFMRHPGETLSRQFLIKHVWNTDYMGDTRFLDVHIRWIREIIEVEPGQPRILLTVRGIGYRFVERPEDDER